MTADREKPPGGRSDEPVEIVGDAGVSARRRASRKLRVPSDTVPRRVAARTSVTDAAGADETPSTEPGAPVTFPDSIIATDSAVSSVSIAAAPANARVSRVPMPRPSTPDPDATAIDTAAPPPETPPVRVPMPRPSSRPPTAGSDAAAVRVPMPRPSQPPVDFLASLTAESTAHTDFASETTPREDPVPDPPPRRPASVRPPRPASMPPPPMVDPEAAAAALIQALVSAQPGASPPPAADPTPDLGVVVRTVRRKIRSVGTGETPTLPSRPVFDPFATSMAVPMPDGSIPVTAEDDFAVPPVDATASAREVPDVEDIDSSVLEEPANEFPDDPTQEIAVPEETGRKRTPKATIPDVPSAKRPPAPPPRAAKSEPREPVATSRKKRAWWEELFGDDYFRTMPKFSPAQIAAEGDFIEASLGVEKGAVVLDVACGDGRQAIELATRGYEVIALDLSLPMLSRASDAAQDRNAKLNFLHSDMREMEFNEMFDAAYCTGTSFGFFDDERNIDVARRLHRALKPGGTLLLDVVNRDYAIQSQPSMCWYEGDGCVCMEETAMNFITSRLTVKRTMILDDGRQKEVEGSIRLYSLHELGQILHNAGFRIVEVSGHPRTPGMFFGQASRQLMILAQKNRRGQSEPSMVAVRATDPSEAGSAGGDGAPPTVN